MKQNNYIIAIDGFSSCGKSTLAKQLAKKLKFAYIDSGAMYRAMTIHFLTHSVDIDNEENVEKFVSLANIEFRYINDQNRIFLNNEDVSEEIYRMYISEKVSRISPLPAVRKALVSHQQKMGINQNIIMDGRDIGTQVFPNATVKLFMTADPKKRAQRRFDELTAKDLVVTLEDIFNNLAQRDHDDTTRKESPLECASDAVVIDNTNLTMEEQFAYALNIIMPKLS